LSKKGHIILVTLALFAAVSYLCAGGAAVASPSFKVAVQSSCPDVLAIDLRGSGETKGMLSPPGQAFSDALQKTLSYKNVQSVPLNYPAVGGKWALIGAKVRVAFWGKYYASVTIGKRALTVVIKELDQSCPSTKVILVGYSQGAHVAGDVYWSLSAKKVYGAVLFGDPKFGPANGVVNKHSFDPWYHGQLGKRKKLTGYKATHLMSFCHVADPVCQNLPLGTIRRIRFAGHENYQSLGEPQVAAEYFAQLIARDSRAPASPPPTGSKSKWPTKKDSGPPAFYMWLGASFIVPEWVSCSDNYCIVGSDDKVLVFELHDIEQIGEIPIDVSDPRAALAKLGISATEIDALLSP
jgi:cutinase